MRASNTKPPAADVTVVKAIPVASLAKVTVAPGSTPPVASVTVPTNRDVVP